MDIRDSVQLAGHVGGQFGAVVQFLRLGELGQIAAEDHEVRFRVHQPAFGHCLHQAAVPVANEFGAADVLDMRIGDIGEGEVFGLVREGQFNQANRQDGAGGGEPGTLDQVAAADLLDGQRCCASRVATCSRISGLVSASMKATKSAFC